MLQNLDLTFLRSSLAKYTRDLTTAALNDEFDPVCCRDREIERVITILVRQSKNNPILVGEAGVGKTAVAEGLAQRIASGDVPKALKNARILSLSHLDLIAGTSFRGQYEKRLQGVVHEASADKDVILFIDELHNLIGAGTAIGAPMDAANMLKPALAGGQIRVIGATTESEYQQYICGDSALERRFQPVFIQELSREETLSVLRARKKRLEMHHLLFIEESVLEETLDLSSRYLPERKEPDRSIDLLDEACAYFRLYEWKDLPREVEELAQERTQLWDQEKQLVSEILKLAEAKGTPIERFSRGTFKALERVGLGMEKLFTGEVTNRPPLPLPDSLRHIQKKDPSRLLADTHCRRLILEDQLLERLFSFNVVLAPAQIRNLVDRSAIKA